MTLLLLPTAGLDDPNQRRRVREVINALLRGDGIIGGLVSEGIVEISYETPDLIINATDGAVDNRRWRFRVGGVSAQMQIGITSDDLTVATNFLIIIRNGMTITAMQYGSAVDNPPHTFNGSIATNGNIRATSGFVAIGDGIPAPTTEAGKAIIYVDSADGDLKVKFGDGTVKTIVTDT